MSLDKTGHKDTCPPDSSCANKLLADVHPKSNDFMGPAALEMAGGAIIGAGIRVLSQAESMGLSELPLGAAKIPLGIAAIASGTALSIYEHGFLKRDLPNSNIGTDILLTAGGMGFGSGLSFLVGNKFPYLPGVMLWGGVASTGVGAVSISEDLKSFEKK